MEVGQVLLEEFGFSPVNIILRIFRNFSSAVQRMESGSVRDSKITHASQRDIKLQPVNNSTHAQLQIRQSKRKLGVISVYTKRKICCYLRQNIIFLSFFI